MFLSVVIVMKSGSSIEHLSKTLLSLDATASFLSNKDRLDLLVVAPSPEFDRRAAAALLTDRSDTELLTTPRPMSFDEAARMGLERSIGDRAIVLPDSEKFLASEIRLGLESADFVSVRFSSRRLGVAASILSMIIPKSISEDWLRGRAFGVSRRACPIVLERTVDASMLASMLRGHGFSVACVTGSVQGPRPSLRALMSRLISGFIAGDDQFIRLIVALSAIAAIANLVYAIWIVAANILIADVTPGWTSSGIHMSLMFFLLSIMAGVSSEYLVQLRRALERRQSSMPTVIKSGRTTRDTMTAIEKA